jgi:hypothetical protein
VGGSVAGGEGWFCLSLAPLAACSRALFVTGAGAGAGARAGAE